MFSIGIWEVPTHTCLLKNHKKFLGKFNFHTEEEWWFGLDFLDLYRSFYYEAGNKGNGALNKKLNEFKKIIDDLQIVIDKNKLSSEVHKFVKNDLNKIEKFSLVYKSYK